MLYCDLEDTGRVFKNKKIYKCTQCGLEAGLEDPDANILCFSKSHDLHVSRMQEMEDLVAEAYKNNTDIARESPEDQPIVSQEEYQKDPASKEQIDARMDICNSCEYYKEEACMLCGCRVVRDSVYQNKLADKNASCPDGRWAAIND